MDIQSQLLYQPQIVPYQPFLVNTVVLNGTVNDSAEVNLFPCGLSKITVPKISGRGQDPVGGKRSPVSYTHLDVYKRQVISSAITVYFGIFITIPLSNLIYKVMKRKGVPS